MVVFPWLDHNDIARGNRLPNAVDLDPAFALKQEEDLLINLYVRTMIIVRHRSRSVERKSAMVQPPPLHDAAKKM